MLIIFWAEVQAEYDFSEDQLDSEYELIFGSSVDSAVFDYGLVVKAQDTNLVPYDPGRDAVVYI